MQDISIRLRNALAGITAHSLEEIPGGCVLATRHLLPSDTVFLAGRSVSAVLLEYGSAGSHATLFAREMGLQWTPEKRWKAPIPDMKSPKEKTSRRRSSGKGRQRDG